MASEKDEKPIEDMSNQEVEVEAFKMLRRMTSAFERIADALESLDQHGITTHKPVL